MTNTKTNSSKPEQHPIMIEARRCVQWNIDCGITTNDKLQTEMFKENPSLIKYRVSLIDEEFRELTEGIEKKDLEETWDALADLLVCTYGALATFGFRLEPIHLLTINESSRSEYLHLFDDIFKCENEKIVTGLNEMLSSSGMKADAKKTFCKDNETIIIDYMKCLSNYVADIKKNIKEENMQDVCRNTVEMTHYILCFGKVLNLDVELGMKTVNDSNYSKLCDTEAEAIKTVEWYKKNDIKRYDSPSYRRSTSGDKFVVFNKSTKKILKNVNWSEPNYKQYITK
jgi:hypothetical protein